MCEKIGIFHVKLEELSWNLTQINLLFQFVNLLLSLHVLVLTLLFFEFIFSL